MSDTLAVRLFGALALERGGRELSPPDRLHGRLLLAYLALHPGAHARGDLADLLWPAVPADSGRSSLRSAVASVRRAVGEAHIAADRERVGLTAVWTDALVFRELLRAGELERALELAGAPLLQGFTGGWVDAERHEHFDRTDHALAVLAARYEEAGDLRRATSLTRRRIALDPLSEPAHRELMRLLAAASDRASALALYAELSERLRAELGIAPSSETRALARALREDGAGEPERPPPAAILGAAEAASRIDAHADAASLYERAAALTAPALRDHAETLIRLGQARLQAGMASEVREPLLEAAEIGRRLGDARLLAEAAIGLSSVPFFPGEEPTDATTVALLGEALALDPPPDVRATLLARLARERWFAADEVEVGDLAEQALSLARAAGEPRAIGAALDTVHLTLATIGDARERLAIADELVAVGERAEDAELVLRGHVLRGVDLLSVGDLDATSHEGALIDALSTRLHRPAYRWWPMLWRATDAIAARRLDDGERIAAEALVVGLGPLGEAAELEAAAQRLWIARERGALAGLTADLDALAARYPMLPVLATARALAYAQDGQHEAATTIVDDLASDAFAGLRRDPGWLVGSVLIAECCELAGDAANARALAEMLAGHEERHAVTLHGSVWLGPVGERVASLADAFVTGGPG
jgi:DNA-binding SARP family transcriptional activator